ESSANHVRAGRFAAAISRRRRNPARGIVPGFGIRPPPFARGTRRDLPPIKPMSKMLEEIRDQPEALSHTLTCGLATALELRRYFETRRPRLIVLVARGTSDNAAQFGRYLVEITTHIPVSLAAPSILTLYGCPVDLDDVLVIGISHSGESTDTNAVLTDARK